MTVRNNRSCSALTGWFFLGLGILWLFSNGYVMVRMTQAQTKIDRLATQLGYTSDNRVRNGRVSASDGNPFTGSKKYNIRYYFTTPMDASTLPTRLQALKLGPRKISINNESSLLVNANAKVNGTPAQELQAQGALPVVPYYIWFLDVDIGAGVYLHETSVLNASIELRGKEFSDNYVELEVDGVRVQLWMLPGLTLWAQIYGYEL